MHLLLGSHRLPLKQRPSWLLLRVWGGRVIPSYSNQSMSVSGTGTGASGSGNLTRTRARTGGGSRPATATLSRSVPGVNTGAGTRKAAHTTRYKGSTFRTAFRISSNRYGSPRFSDRGPGAIPGRNGHNASSANNWPTTVFFNWACLARAAFFCGRPRPTTSARINGVIATRMC